MSRKKPDDETLRRARFLMLNEVPVQAVANVVGMSKERAVAMAIGFTHEHIPPLGPQAEAFLLRRLSTLKGSQETIARMALASMPRVVRGGLWGTVPGRAPLTPAPQPEHLDGAA